MSDGVYSDKEKNDMREIAGKLAKAIDADVMLEPMAPGQISINLGKVPREKIDQVINDLNNFFADHGHADALPPRPHQLLTRSGAKPADKQFLLTIKGDYAVEHGNELLNVFAENRKELDAIIPTAARDSYLTRSNRGAGDSADTMSFTDITTGKVMGAATLVGIGLLAGGASSIAGFLLTLAVGVAGWFGGGYIESMLSSDEKPAPKKDKGIITSPRRVASKGEAQDKAPDNHEASMNDVVVPLTNFKAPQVKTERTC